MKKLTFTLAALVTCAVECRCIAHIEITSESSDNSRALTATRTSMLISVSY